MFSGRVVNFLTFLATALDDAVAEVVEAPAGGLDGADDVAALEVDLHRVGPQEPRDAVDDEGVDVGGVYGSKERGWLYI